MAKDSDPLAGAFETKETGGILAGLLAEENEFDRRMMWRLGTWGVAAVGAVIVAVMANQAELGWRRNQVATADFARQAERLQAVSRESQNEARRLASAVETLNSDRDRLYARVTVLEQGLDSVTGAIARQAATPIVSGQPAAKPEAVIPDPSQPAPQAAAPSVGPVASTAPVQGDRPRAEASKDQTAKELAKELAKEPTKGQTAKDPAPKDRAARDAAKEAAKEAAKDQAPLPPQTAAAASLVPSAAGPTALPTIPLVASKSIMAPPDPAASKLVQLDQPGKPQAEATTSAERAGAAEVAAATPAKEADAAAEDAPTPAITVQQTRFALDLGSASSIDGLRGIWRGLIKSNPELASLRPIIMIKEGKTGLGMQLSLGAGPLVNAAAAAKYCAALVENGRACETTVFDGQRLSMRADVAGAPAETPAASSAKSDGKAESKPEAKADKHRRSYSAKRTKHEEPAPPPAPAAAAKPEATSTLSSFFRRQ